MVLDEFKNAQIHQPVQRQIVVGAVVNVAFLEIQRAVVNPRVKGVLRVDNREIAVFSNRVIGLERLPAQRIIRIDNDIVDAVNFFGLLWRFGFDLNEQIYLVFPNSAVYLHLEVIGIKEEVSFLLEARVNAFAFGFDDVEVVAILGFEKSTFGFIGHGFFECCRVAGKSNLPDFVTRLRFNQEIGSGLFAFTRRVCGNLGVEIAFIFGITLQYFFVEF